LDHRLEELSGQSLSGEDEGPGKGELESGPEALAHALQGPQQRSFERSQTCEEVFGAQDARYLSPRRSLHASQQRVQLRTNLSYASRLPLRGQALFLQGTCLVEQVLHRIREIEAHETVNLFKWLDLQIHQGRI